MSNIHISVLDSVKMTGQTQCTKVSLNITIRKKIFTLTYVDLVYETSISIWEFE